MAIVKAKREFNQNWKLYMKPRMYATITTVLTASVLFSQQSKISQKPSASVRATSRVTFAKSRFLKQQSTPAVPAQLNVKWAA